MPALPSVEPIFERVLITNDDGIDATWLAVLQGGAATTVQEVWIVAPEDGQSGTSHSISPHPSLRYSRQGERRFSIFVTLDGFVIMAAQHLMVDMLPALILSGVNRSVKRGTETVFSSTVGAAMTGMLLGSPSITSSPTFTDINSVRWKTVCALASGVIQRLVKGGLPAQTCLNANLADVPADQTELLSSTRQGAELVKTFNVPRTDRHRFIYRRLQFQWEPCQDAADSEATAVANGRFSVTPLRFEHTDDASLGAMLPWLLKPEDSIP